MLAHVNFYEWIVGSGAITAFILVAGLVAGQFRRGVVEELRASLKTATDEILIERGRNDRLEKTLAANEATLKQMESRLVALETENSVLRGTLQSGIKLAPEFQALIAEQLQRHEERSERMIHSAATAAAQVAADGAKNAAIEASKAAEKVFLQSQEILTANVDELMRHINGSLAEALEKVAALAVKAQHERDVAETAALAAFEDRVIKRHEKLAEMLPKTTGRVLKKALEEE